MEEAIVRIPLDQIVPHPGNRRVGGMDQVKLEQLADSIRAVGVQQPAIVRQKGESFGLPHPPGGSVPLYELVAGERRWRASKLAQVPDLPCVVRDLDDVAALKIQTVENLQREDVHPLDEADGYQRLLDVAGYAIEQVASELGKSASYVYQRLKLRDLVPEARKLFVDGKITAGHAILIARLQDKQQQTIVKEKIFGWGDEAISIRNLTSYIQQYIMMELSGACWKRDDAELVPEAGACEKCTKRSGYHPDLFADVCKDKKKDYCTDPKCFNAKHAALIALRRKELVDQEYLQVKGDGAGYSTTGKGPLNRYEWKECGKKEPGAKRALIVEGKGAGRITWGKDTRSPGRRESSHETAAAKAKREKEARARKKQQAIRIAIYKAIMEKLGKKLEGIKKEILPEPVLVFAAVAVAGESYNTEGLCEAEGWSEERMNSDHIKKMNSVQLLLVPLKYALKDYLDEQTWQPLKDFMAIAAAAGVDVKKVTAAATEEFEAAVARKCRVCGCTDDDCRQCIEKTGEPCRWVEKDLCSACVKTAKKKGRKT